MFDGRLSNRGTRIRRGSLRDQVQDQIKGLILTNELRPGAPIVIDRLASDLGVSHTPVREALVILENDGLVELRPYQNPRVASIKAADVEDAWDMRLLLEGWAVRHAVEVLSSEDLDELEAMLSDALDNAQQSRYEAHRKSDILLHKLLLETVDNKLFLRMAAVMTDHSLRIRYLVEAISPSEKILEIIEEHFQLCDALRRRDPDLARNRLVAHLEAGKQRTLDALEALRARERGLR